MQTTLLSIIAGLLLVLCAKIEHPEKVDNKFQLLIVVLVNYLFPLIAALICGAIIFSIASGLSNFVTG